MEKKPSSKQTQNTKPWTKSLSFIFYFFYSFATIKLPSNYKSLHNITRVRVPPASYLLCVHIIIVGASGCWFKKLQYWGLQPSIGNIFKTTAVFKIVRNPSTTIQRFYHIGYQPIIPITLGTTTNWTAPYRPYIKIDKKFEFEWQQQYDMRRNTLQWRSPPWHQVC